MKTPLFDMKVFKTLKMQIALYFLITSLVLITLIGGAFYYSTSVVILNNELKSTIASVEQSGKYIEVYIEKIKVFATLLSQNPDTLGYLQSHDSESENRIMAFIQNALEADSALVSIVIVGKDGEVLSNETSLDMSVSKDMMKEEWYVNAVQSHQMPVLTSARQQKFSMNKATWVISMSQEIVDSKGENLGVLLLDIKYQGLEDYITNMDLGKLGYAFIINDKMDVVYHPDSSYFQEPEKRKMLLDLSNRRVGYDKSMGMLIHHYKINKTDWTLVGLSSLDDLAVIRRQILEMLIFAGIVFFIIVMVGGLFVADRITNPIKKLEFAMVNFEKEMKTIEIDEKGCYEVVSLSQHFNKMIVKMNKLLNEIKENETYLRTYEINALHSQINPHFLYNTLDTIVWMAEFNDSQKVIAVTKSLAQFFRLSLSKGKEMISLKEEMEHVKQYLFIQVQRYGDDLSYDFNVSEQLLELEVPKIILQPLVENAIYHGIREKGEKGHVVISAEVLDGKVVLKVEDNGVGFNHLNPSKAKTKLGGVGIDNVNQRIKLYYGEDYGVHVTSEIGVGTKAEITIPLEKKNTISHETH